MIVREKNDYDDHDAEDDCDKGDGLQVDSCCNLALIRIYKYLNIRAPPTFHR